MIALICRHVRRCDQCDGDRPGDAVRIDTAEFFTCDACGMVTVREDA